MKTENLTWAEAIKAYANGERIRGNCGGEYWIEKDVPADNNPKKHGEHWFPIPEVAPFSIVKPEPKKLTFDEAAKCSRVRVTLPKELNGGNYVLDNSNWNWALLDLAERKGWPITVVE